MFSKMLEFKIEKCDYNNASAGCHEETLVKDFINDIHVDTWAIHPKIDFKERSYPPTYLFVDLLSSVVLNDD